MKYFLFCLTVLAISLSDSYAQEVFSEDFEEGLFPEGWTTFAHGAGDWTWAIFPNSSIFMGRAGVSAALDIENTLNQKWLVSPRIGLASNSTLEFYATDDEDQDLMSELIIYVTTGSDSSDIDAFDYITSFQEDDITTHGKLQKFTLDLSEYGTQSVHIAFVMEGFQGGFWHLDNISVGKKTADDIQLLSLETETTNSYFEAGDAITLRASFYNNGTDDLSSSRSVTFREGDNIIGTTNLFSLPAEGTNTAAINWTPSVSGSYDLSVEIAPDDNNNNNISYLENLPVIKSSGYITESFSINSDFPPERWRIENITGNDITHGVNIYSYPAVLQSDSLTPSQGRLITPPVTVGDSDILAFKTSLWNSRLAEQLIVIQYSTDGSSFMNLDTITAREFSTSQAVDLSGLAAGEYYFAINISLSTDHPDYEARILIDDVCTPEYWVNPDPELHIPGGYEKEPALTRINQTDSIPVYLKNTGSSELEISGVDVNTPFFSEYSSLILPGETDTAWIQFEPLTIGTFTEKVTFQGTFDGGDACFVTGLVYPEDYVLNDFESVPEKTGIMMSNGTKISDPDITFDGEKCYKLSSGSGYLALPKLNIDQGDQLYFYVRMRGVIPDEFGLYYTDDIYTDPSTWTEIKDLNPDLQNNPHNKYFLYHAELPEEASGNHLVLYGSVQYLGLYLDHFVYPQRYFESPPECVIQEYPLPGTEDVDTNTEFSWQYTSEASGYKVYLIEGSGDPVAPENLIYEGDSNEYKLTERLKFNTVYSWSVVPFNTAGGAAGCSYQSFTTEKDPTHALPFTEDFNELSNLPEGWSSSDADIYEEKGLYSAGLCLQQWKDVKTVELPPAGPVGANTILSFDYRWVSSDDESLPFDPSVNDDRLEVFVSTDFGDTYTHSYTLDQNNHTLSNKFQNISISLGPFSGERVKVKLVQTDNSTDYYSFDLDNFMIYDPSNYSVTSYFPGDKLYLKEGETGNFIVYLKNTGLNQDEYSFSYSSEWTWDYTIKDKNNLETNSITIEAGSLDLFIVSTEMPAGLNYGDSDSMNLDVNSLNSVGLKTIGTLYTNSIDPVVPEYYESFDEYSTIPPGWSDIVYSSWSTYSGSVKLNTNSDDHFVSFMNMNDRNADLILVSPEIERFNNTRLKFTARAGSSGNTLEVGTISDPENRLTFNPLKTLTLTADYQTYVVEEFALYSGTDKYFAIKHGEEANYQTANVDDVYFEYLTTDPIIDILNDSIYFENVPPGTVSDPDSVVIKNIGAGILQVDTIILEGPHADQFILDWEEIPDYPVNLANDGSSLVVKIRQVPTELFSGVFAELRIKTSLGDYECSIFGVAGFDEGEICERAISFGSEGGVIGLEGSQVPVSEDFYNSTNEMWYFFDINYQYDSIIFSTCGSSINTLLEIYDECGSADWLYYNDDSNYCGSFSEQSMIVAKDLPQGRYYGRICGDSGTFKFSIIRSENTVNDLADLKLDGITVPGFSPEKSIYSYQLACNKPTPVITATAMDPLASLVIQQAGEGELADTVAKIIVESESGLIKEYQVNLDYTGHLDVAVSADNAISSGFKLNFDPALPGLNASDIGLWNTDSDLEIPVIAVSSNDNGNSFFVTASISEDVNYMVKSANNCYKFDQNPVFNYQNTAVNGFAEDSFKLYPNPANDIITITHTGSGKTRLKISDLGGRLIDVYELYDPEIQIDISDLSKGVYFFHLKSEKVSTVKMVVIEN